MIIGVEEEEPLQLRSGRYLLEGPVRDRLLIGQKLHRHDHKP
jgi:hypothetical protein